MTRNPPLLFVFVCFVVRSSLSSVGRSVVVVVVVRSSLSCWCPAVDRWLLSCCAGRAGAGERPWSPGGRQALPSRPPREDQGRSRPVRRPRGGLRCYPSVWAHGPMGPPHTPITQRVALLVLYYIILYYIILYIIILLYIQ